MLSTGVSFQPLRDVFGEVSNGCCWTQDQERGQDFGRRQHRWRSGGDISARSLSRRRISAVSVCRGGFGACLCCCPEVRAVSG